MAKRDVQPLRELLHRMLVRYLTVRPQGLILKKSSPPRASVQARILNHGGARTLYRDRRPHCRSLDGVRSVTHPGRRCADCKARKRCTPQVRLDLVIDTRSYRLLVAHTSARNFLTYQAELTVRSLLLEDEIHRIDVLDRGTWGELRFSKQTRPSHRPPGGPRNQGRLLHLRLPSSVACESQIAWDATTGLPEIHFKIEATVNTRARQLLEAPRERACPPGGAGACGLPRPPPHRAGHSPVRRPGEGGKR